MFRYSLTTASLSLAIHLIATVPFSSSWLYAQQGHGKHEAELKRNDVPSMEIKIRAALEKQCEIDFVETPLEEIVEWFEANYQINVVLDTRALDAVGIRGSTPITRYLKDVSLGSALGLMLRNLELVWIIQNEVLLITTPEEAEANPQTRVYEVGDLVARPAVGGQLVYGAQSDDNSDLESLINVITASVVPDSWDQVGGVGTIEPLQYADKYVLVVSQTESVHSKIAQLLDSLRRLKSTAPAKEQVGRKEEDEAPDEVFVKVYPILGGIDTNAGAIVELIETALDSAGWNQESGTFVRTVANTVVVKHNGQIHEQVRELLVGVNAIASPPGLDIHQSRRLSGG